ncbi:MAG: NAD(P)H-dependent oxidoreductase [Bacteroidia bacterium]|nr:NAD(P)H-dependent oxidoreductase [Bacteroidia bacterium]
MNLLHINSSPRGEYSRTLKISKSFIQELSTQVNALQVDQMDLFDEDLPSLNGMEANTKMALMGGIMPEGDAKAAWDKIANYATNFLKYDAYLISAPMWNFGLPYKLKQYIDTIIQAGISFEYTPEGPRGLVNGKKMFVITSRGADYSSNSPMNSFDFMENYLKAIFGFVGIYDITFVHAQPLDMDPGLTELKMNEAQETAKQMANNFS